MKTLIITAMLALTAITGTIVLTDPAAAGGALGGVQDRHGGP
jgi:hypothetical protein